MDFTKALETLVAATVLEAAEAVIGGGGGGKSSRKERRVRPMMSTQYNLPYFLLAGKKDEKPWISQKR